MRLWNSSCEWLPPPRRLTNSAEDHLQKDRRKQLALLFMMISAIAFTVRFFQWQDHCEVAMVTQMTMNQYYLNDARPLIRGDLREFLCGTDPAHDANPLAHPPGYGLLMAASIVIFGNHNLPLQLFQIFCDAVCAGVIFLIAVEFLPIWIGLFAGLIVAFSPQLGFYSLLLLPDSLVTLPILLATLLIMRAIKHPRLKNMIVAGALIGLSCWIRPNGLLLAPFLSVLLFLLFKRGQRFLYAMTLTAAMALVISPITLRNYLVFHRFIPVSSAVGTNLLEGIGEYDEEKRFGLPGSDLALMQQEAQIYNRPDYSSGLYNPDGLERDSLRVTRALSVIRQHPLWFTKVMLKRVWYMLELQDGTMPEFKVRPNPPLERPISIPDGLQPVWSTSPAALVSSSVIAQRTEVRVEEDGARLRLVGDYFPFWTDHIVSAPITVQPHTVYLLKVPIKLDAGRVILSVMSPDLQTEIASVTTPNPVEVRDTTNQPLRDVLLSFSTGESNEVSLVLRDGAMGSGKLVAQVGRIDMFATGASAATSWSHYPRVVTRSIQQTIMATWILPFVGLGIALLLLAGRGRVVLMIVAVPAYYLCLQAPIHVEPRYIIAVHYFFIILAVVPLYWMGSILVDRARRLHIPLHRSFNTTESSSSI